MRNLKEYERGSLHRVANVTGCYLHGLKPTRGGFTGWSVKLEPGDVLTCGGFRRGWGSDPGPDIVTWTHLNGEPITDASFIEFSHSRSGAWETRPRPEYLERFQDGEAGA